MDTGEAQVDYRSHILVGVRADGVMTVIADWPHVPTQADVQDVIHGTPGSYASFALCTPTSILPGKRGVEVTKKVPSRFGPPVPVRRR